MNNFEKNREILSEAAIAIPKDDIMRYQIKHKVDWNTAKSALEGIFADAAKVAKKAAAAEVRKLKAAAPRKPREKYMSDAEYKKIVKGAGMDFVGDTASDLKHDHPDLSKEELKDMARDQLGDVAWDLAGSLAYNPDIDKYVRKQISKNTGKRPEDIKDSRVQEYIADDIT